MIAQIAQMLQPIIDIKKSWLSAHRIVSDPSRPRESETPRLR